MFSLENIVPLIQQIIAGVIVAVVTSIIGWVIFDKKSTKEHRLKIKTSNEKILSTIRQLMPDQIHIINSNTIKTIIKTTALQSNIPESELHSVQTVINLLTVEILNSTYLSTSDKESLLSKIEMLKPLSSQATFTKEATDEYFKELGNRKRILVLSIFCTVLFSIQIIFPFNESIFITVNTVILLLLSFSYLALNYYRLFYKYSSYFFDAEKNYSKKDKEYSTQTESDYSTD